MRVVAGSARGVPLEAPSGRVRPTSDLVKGAMFSALGDRGCTGRVLDLYAGSGALGIEALSRGAEFATFVDSSRAACRMIEANLRRCRLDAQAKVYCLPVQRALDVLEAAVAAGQEAPYHLALLDPPYADIELDATVARLGVSPILAASAIILVEHAAARPLAKTYGQAQWDRTRRHGDSAFSIYRVEDEQDDRRPTAQPSVGT